MLQISDVCIISIDKSDDSWAIEGEIVFENDLTAGFEVTYLADEDELEDFTSELSNVEVDLKKLKEMILENAMSYEE